MSGEGARRNMSGEMQEGSPSAERRRSGSMRSTPLALAVAAVVVAAALLGVAAMRTSGDDMSSASQEGPSGTAPVSSVARACPAFGTKDADSNGLSVGNVTLKSDASASGGSSKASVVPGEKAVPGLSVDSPGAWASASVDAKASAVALNAEEGLAPFSTAFAAARPAGRLGGGMAMTQCSEAQSSAWFVGAGSTANHSGTLVLSNPTEIDAVVDVSLYGGHEEIEVVGGSGIVVEPGKSKQLPLDDLGTGEDELAIEVRASQGSIAANVLDTTGKLNPYGGSEYLPVAARPSTQATIAGVPAGSDERELLVVNPGDRAANVSVSVVGKDGAFTPSGLESVSVDSGAIKAVDLPGRLGNAGLSVRLESESPVTGAVRLISDDDVAYAVASEKFQEPVVVPTGVGDAVDGADLEVAVSGAARKGETSVQVRAFAANGSAVGKEATVKVAAGTTATFDPLEKTGVSSGKTAYVTLRASDGVRGAATYRDSGDLTSVPLADLPATVVRPGVSPGGAR